MKFTSAALFVLVIVLSFGLGRARAQTITAATPTQFTGVGVHTSCQISAALQTNVCIAGDGVWVSTNGAAYFQLTTGGVSAGVTSFNGQTGAVTFTSPVTSVALNGLTKTGAVSFTLATPSTVSAQ